MYITAKQASKNIGDSVHSLGQELSYYHVVDIAANRTTFTLDTNWK